MEGDLPEPRNRRRDLGTSGVPGCSEGETAHQVDVLERHSGDRWRSGGRVLRLAGNVRVRSQRQSALEAATWAASMSGAYDAPDYEWGTASSPILYRDMVIAQCDQQKGSFLIALDRKTGNTVWKTERDELPSWGTPTVYPGKTRPELVTNGSNFIRGYDPISGKELWRLGGSSKITAPTPIYSGDLIVVASGRRPEAPIFAVRAGASGDITQKSSVAWSKTQRGSYMPTPLFYDGLLYVLGNAGIFDCYDFKSGREIYRERIPHQGSGFSASPVASDGNIYLPGEDGDIFVVQAGRQFAVLNKNSMEEPIMATPAISGGLLIVRTQHHLWGIRRK